MELNSHGRKKETSKQKAESLLKFVNNSKEVHNIFADSIKRQVLISGQSLEFWEKHFRFRIDTDNLTPTICKMYNLKLLDLNDEACFLHASADVKVQLIKRGADSTYRDKYFALVTESRLLKEKLPSATTLENLARVNNDDVEGALAIAEMEKKYWQNILSMLEEKRKLIESANFSNNTEQKMITGV